MAFTPTATGTDTSGKPINNQSTTPAQQSIHAVATPEGNVQVTYNQEGQPIGLANPNQTYTSTTPIPKGITASNGSTTIGIVSEASFSNGKINFTPISVSSSGTYSENQTTPYGNVALNITPSISKGSVVFNPMGLANPNQTYTRTVNANTLNNQLLGNITETMKAEYSNNKVTFNVIGASGTVQETQNVTLPNFYNQQEQIELNLNTSYSNGNLGFAIASLANPTGTHTFAFSTGLGTRNVVEYSREVQSPLFPYIGSNPVGVGKENVYYYINNNALNVDVVTKQSIQVVSGMNTVGGVSVFGANVGGKPTPSYSNLYVRASSLSGFSFTNQNTMNGMNHYYTTFGGNQENFTYGINKSTGSIKQNNYLTVGKTPFTITPTELEITAVAIGAGIATGGLADVGLAAIGVTGLTASAISGASSFAVMNVVSGELSSQASTGKLQSAQSVVTEAAVGAVEGVAFAGVVAGGSFILSKIFPSSVVEGSAETSILSKTTTSSGETKYAITNLDTTGYSPEGLDKIGLSTETSSTESVAATKFQVKSGILGRTTNYYALTQSASTGMDLTDTLDISATKATATNIFKETNSGLTLVSSKAAVTGTDLTDTTITQTANAKPIITNTEGLKSALPEDIASKIPEKASASEFTFGTGKGGMTAVDIGEGKSVTGITLPEGITQEGIGKGVSIDIGGGKTLSASVGNVETDTLGNVKFKALDISGTAEAPTEAVKPSTFDNGNIVEMGLGNNEIVPLNEAKTEVAMPKGITSNIQTAITEQSNAVSDLMKGGNPSYGLGNYGYGAGGISVIGTGNGMVMAQRNNAISVEQSVQLGLVKSAQAGLSTQATNDLSIGKSGEQQVQIQREVSITDISNSKLDFASSSGVSMDNLEIGNFGGMQEQIQINKMITEPLINKPTYKGIQVTEPLINENGFKQPTIGINLLNTETPTKNKIGIGTIIMPKPKQTNRTTSISITEPIQTNKQKSVQITTTAITQTQTQKTVTATAPLETTLTTTTPNINITPPPPKTYKKIPPVISLSIMPKDSFNIVSKQKQSRSKAQPEYIPSLIGIESGKYLKASKKQALTREGSLTALPLYSNKHRRM